MSGVRRYVWVRGYVWVCLGYEGMSGYVWGTKVCLGTRVYLGMSGVRRYVWVRGYVKGYFLLDSPLSLRVSILPLSPFKRGQYHLILQLKRIVIFPWLFYSLVLETNAFVTLNQYWCTPELCNCTSELCNCTPELCNYTPELCNCTLELIRPTLASRI